jgi:ABC-2 type transport system permease protein
LATEGPDAGVARALVGEWRRVLAEGGVFSVLIIAPVFYGMVYLQPYLGQLARKIPIASSTTTARH